MQDQIESAAFPRANSSPRQLSDKSLLKSQAYVNGKWVDAKSGKTFDVHGASRQSLYPHRTRACGAISLMLQTDPSSHEKIGSMPEMDASDAEAAIQAAQAAGPAFRKLTARQRSKMLRKWYDLMVDNAEDLAKLITWENGKPFADAKGEVAYAANFFEWFSEEAVRIYGDTIQATVPGNRVFTIKEPVGVCGLITPSVNVLASCLSATAVCLYFLIIYTDGIFLPP